MIRVLVADDHPIVRTGLRALIEADPDMTFVGEASSGDDAIHKYESMVPDVLVLDLQMPRKTGLKPFVQMLPDESPSNVLGAGHYGDWSQSGAIINAQRVNTEKGYTGGILYGGVSPNVAASTFKVDKMKGSTSTHTYSTEWSLRSMKFFQDSKKVYTAKNWYTNDTGNIPAGAPFDKPFYLMLAMSAGGDQTGTTGAQVAKTLRKPQSFKIEYVQICEAI